MDNDTLLTQELSSLLTHVVDTLQQIAATRGIDYAERQAIRFNLLLGLEEEKGGIPMSPDASAEETIALARFLGLSMTGVTEIISNYQESLQRKEG